MKISAASLFLSLLLISCALEPFTVPQVYLNSGDLKMNIQAEASAVSAFSISPDGRYLLTVDNGGTMTASDFGIVRMWDLVEGRQIFKRTNTLKLARAVAISPDGRYAVTGGETRPFLGGRSVKKEQEQEQYGLNVWDLGTGTIIKKFAGFKGPGMYVCDIKFSRDGRYLLASSFKQIYVFDTRSWKAIRKYSVSCCVATEFSPDGKNLLFGDGDGLLHLWDIAASRKVWSIQGYKSSFMSAIGASAIAFSPDGKSVLTSWGNDDVVRLWDTASGKMLKEFTGFKKVGNAIDLTGVNGLSLSPDGKQVMIFAKPMKILEVRTGKELVDFSGAWKGELLLTGNALSGAYLPDGRRVMLNLSDSAVRMYDAQTGEEMAMFVGFSDGEWLVITKEGYYNASEKGDQYLTVKMGDKDYSVDSFYDVFYRPDIVAAKLRGEDIKDLITITMKDAIKTPPPVVEISSLPSTTSDPKVKVCYKAKSTGGGIGEVRLFHNGKLIESDGYYKEVAKTSEKMQLASLTSNKIYEDMRSVKIKEKTDISPVTTKTKGDVFNDCKELEAISGENEISITAFNKDNTVQGYMQTAKFNSTIKQEEPHLYILSIGTDQYKDATVNLKYAVKDAGDIKEKMLKQAETLYKPENIHHISLTDKEATKTNIISRINELSKMIKPTDSFILFVAGHGVLLQNQYYMLTSEYDGNVNESTMISSNEIVEISKKIKSLSQLFIFDTCHAGGVDYIISGLYDARMSVLAKKMGLHIYASANSKEDAMDGYQGNGLFTYTLLDGLNNNKNADKNKDNKISLTELGEYSKTTTTDISKKIGHTQTPLIINFGKDNAVYNLR